MLWIALKPRQSWQKYYFSKSIFSILDSSDGYRGFKHMFLQKSICQGGSTSDPHDFTLGLCARLCWDCYCSQHSSSTQQNEEDQRSKRTQLRRAKERPLFLLACRGSFNNYVDIIFTFFDRLPTSTWTIFNQNVDKNRCLLTTYPSQSVHVIFEWPLTPPAGKLWSFTNNQSLILDFLE